LPGYDVNQDTGLFIRDGYKSVNNFKVCPESDWAYKVSQYTVKPPSSCYDEAVKMNSDYKYYSVNQDLNSLKTCIYEGYPISYGMTLFESFENEYTASTGIVQIPNKYSEQQVGGHALSIVGYDDENQWFIIANSWSNQWGNNGFCYIPYQYILDPELANDFWTVRTYAINPIKDNVANMSMIDSQIKQELQNNKELNDYIKSQVDKQIKEYITAAVADNIKSNYA